MTKSGESKLDKFRAQRILQVGLTRAPDDEEYFDMVGERRNENLVEISTLELGKIMKIPLLIGNEAKKAAAVRQMKEALGGAAFMWGAKKFLLYENILKEVAAGKQVSSASR